MSEEQITIAQMQKDIDYIKGDISELKKLLSDFIDQADKKYAPRAAWDVLVWAARSAGVIVVGIIVYLILKFGHLAI